MKIETRVETLRRVEVEMSLPEYSSKLAEEMGDSHGTWHESAEVGDVGDAGEPRLQIANLYSLPRSRWEAFKKLGDAAWETWDKTFGDKQPETMGVWRTSSFVWFPGDRDFKGSAQRALDALKAEKPEWKLELREYKKSEAKTTTSK